MLNAHNRSNVAEKAQGQEILLPFLAPSLSHTGLLIFPCLNILLPKMKRLA